MPHHKNQHYVAKHYLKRFGGASGRTICLCHLPSNKWIASAPIASQASEDYFYGRDGQVEKFLHEIESRGDPLFARIVRERALPHNPDVQQDLLGMMVLMYARTRRRSVEMAAVPNAVLTESMKRMVKQGVLPEPPPQLDLEKVKVALTIAPALAVFHTMQSLPLLYDIKLKLLLAPADHFFITSDHPVVALNQAFRDKGHHSVIGLAWRGFQLLLPLSPNCALFAYDPACYRVGRPEKRQMTLSQPRDVEIINILQILNADEHLYVRDFAMRPALEKLVRKYVGDRTDADRKVKIIQDAEGKKGRTYYMSSSSGPLLPGVWSFCSVRATEARYPFDVRDPHLCRAIQEWSRDPNGKQVGKAFEAWMDERA